MIEFKKTTEFQRSYKRLEKKFPSLKEDFTKLAASLMGNPNQGVLMADNFRKIRLAIKSKGKGKRGSARVITINCLTAELDGTVSFIAIYDKNDMESVSIRELRRIWESEKERLMKH